MAFVMCNSFASQPIESVNVYSFRKGELINPLLSEFTRQTGIKVNVVSGKADKLMDRLIDDGDNSFADVMLTADVARLERAKKLDLIQPVSSAYLAKQIPEKLRDSQNYWFGVSLRVRAIFYAKNKVNTDNILNYLDLTEKQWHGKICSRKGEHFYNRSMVASFLFQYGESWTNDWVTKFVNNLAERPNGGDRDQLRKVASGKCDLAIANSYYYGMMSISKKASDRRVYQQVGIIFPTNKGLGAHTNISGAAVTKAAKNKENAVKFIEFLATPKAQKIYTEMNYEYSVLPELAPKGIMESWGHPAMDINSIQNLYHFHNKAQTMIEKSHW